MKTVFIVFLLSSLFKMALLSDILVVAPFKANSHTYFIHPICKNLAIRGHNITLITSIEMKNSPENIYQILVDVNLEVPHGGFAQESDASYSIFEDFQLTMSVEKTYTENVLNSPKVKALINDRSANFDLVIVELFHQQAMYMFSYIFQAPLVLISSTDLSYKAHAFTGNPFYFSLMNYEYSRLGFKNTFYKRLGNLYHNILDFYNYEFMVLPAVDEIARRHFGHLEKSLPSVKSLAYNTSLVICNCHFSLGETLPLVPAIVEAAGIHIKPVKKLPEDIQNFLDDAKDGAIVFSLGTVFYSSCMKNKTLEAFVDAFSKRKEKIIWKWEDDNPPKLNNTLFKKWIPLNDILVHRNIKALITHGGMLSVQESIDKGVPIIGMPIYADQFLNIDKLVAGGTALKLNYYNVDEQSVSEALNALISQNKRYKKRMEALSLRFKDRPVEPLKIAIYWIEYVIKHGGESLKPERFSVLQCYCVDILVCLTIIVWLLNLAIRKFNNVTVKTKKD